MSSTALTRTSVMFWDLVRRTPVAGLFGVVVFAHVLAAQATDTVQTESRASLIARARRADSLHLRSESFSLHTRLQDGDFDVGDHISITYAGPYSGLGQPSGEKEYVVRAGKILPLEEPMGDLSLNGMLRSELADSVKHRVDKYFKDVVVHVAPRLRLSISGGVRNAGFFYPKPDQPLTDLIMGTGGQDQNADLSNIQIKRGTEVLWSNADVQAALADGLTIERLNLQSGDEIVVGIKHAPRWQTIVQYTSFGLTTVISLWYLFSRVR